MPETLKDRSQLDPRFTWDLSRLFADDAAWEQAFAGIDAGIAAAAAFAGRLNEAPVILQYLQASTALSRKLSDLYCYASMRHSEDTRAEAAQSMYARISAKYAAAVAALSFAEPEMLALRRTRAWRTIALHCRTCCARNPTPSPRPKKSCSPPSARWPGRRPRSPTRCRTPTLCSNL